MWTSRKGFQGSTLYLKDGKLVKSATVPDEVKAQLANQASVEPEVPADEKPARVCIFCGNPAPFYRLLNGETIDLCVDDYHNQSLGKIAEKVRERDNAAIQG